MHNEPKDLAAATDEQLRQRLTTGRAIEAPSTAASGPAAWKVEGAGRLIAEVFGDLGKPERRASSGFQRLDRFLGGEGTAQGFMVPSLVLVGAGPKSSKSTFACAIAEHHVRSRGVATIVDLENGWNRWARRLIHRDIAIGKGRLERHLRGEVRLKPEEIANLERCAREWGAEGELGRRLVRYPDRLLGELRPEGVSDVVRRLADYRADLIARNLADASRPLLLVFDSIQKLPGRLEQRRDAVDAWIRALETARHETPDVVILAVSEFGRAKDAAGERPRYSGFKESSGLEFTADLALALEPIEHEDPTIAEGSEPPWHGRALRLVAVHNRDGDAGPVSVLRTVRPWFGLEETGENPSEEATAAPQAAPAPAGRGKGARKQARPTHAQPTEEPDAWITA
jgi:hypothetical protein